MEKGGFDLQMAEQGVVRLCSATLGPT